MIEIGGNIAEISLVQIDQDYMCLSWTAMSRDLAWKDEPANKEFILLAGNLVGSFIGMLMLHRLRVRSGWHDSPTLWRIDSHRR